MVSINAKYLRQDLPRGNRYLFSLQAKERDTVHFQKYYNYNPELYILFLFYLK